MLNNGLERENYRALSKTTKKYVIQNSFGTLRQKFKKVNISN